MTRLAPRGRSGITLTEILIAIMIMGIGLVSLATLFPLGLLRLRSAARDSRSTLEAEVALSEISARNLFQADSFTYSWYGSKTASYNPWTNDPYFPNPSNVKGVSPIYGSPGLPVVYDPLFWANIDFTAGINPLSTAAKVTPRDSARFGSGMGFVRNDPSDGGPPSAYGLQRITNFLPAQPNGVDDNGNGVNDPTDDFELYWPFTYPTAAKPDAMDLAGEIFASPDDPVLQKEGNTNTAAGIGSPVALDMSLGTPQRDYAYSWFFTGQQVAAGDQSVLNGSIVVCHNRPFGLDPVATTPFTNPVVTQTMVATGDRVVEAAWAWSTNVPKGGGYSLGDDRAALLRWPDDTPDPIVPTGSWIADVTYERIETTSRNRFGVAGPYPGQRCHWYRVVKRTEPVTEATPFAEGQGSSGKQYRRMLLTLDRSVQAKTRLKDDGLGSPIVVNAALIAPYVVNVFPKVIYSR
jgi:type II secretory pathway pseudopilin PulG